MNAKVYLNLDAEEFDKQRASAKKRSADSFGEDDTNGLLWETLKMEYDPKESPEFKEGKMNIAGETSIGYISVDFDLDLETVVTIIEFYQKRLNKLKTVLEGIK